jgi:hypothetical protein
MPHLEPTVKHTKQMIRLILWNLVAFQPSGLVLLEIYKELTTSSALSLVNSSNAVAGPNSWSPKLSLNVWPTLLKLGWLCKPGLCIPPPQLFDWLDEDIIGTDDPQMALYPDIPANMLGVQLESPCLSAPPTPSSPLDDPDWRRICLLRPTSQEGIVELEK